MSIRDRIKKFLRRPGETEPAVGYDCWSASYDQQPGNLMLDLDETIFSGFLKAIDLRGKAIIDVGCGTGRHWKKILEQDPARLVGYDASSGMLEKLKEKIPGASVFLSDGARLPGLADHSCDWLVSTLTIAHIENIGEAVKEWDRVLKPEAGIILTDYHPTALEKGAKRTFRHQGKTIAVKNHIHPVAVIRELLEQRGFRELRFTERRIDDTVRSYYEKQNALELFERFREVPVIYGILLKRTDDPA